MKDKINVAELLKDCPKGMELDCTMYDNLYFDSLNADYYGTINCYTLIDGIKTSINFTKYGTFNNHIGAKCVIFPKGKTTWEGFRRPFKDGDVVCYSDCIAIFKEWGDETLFRTYVTAYLHGDSTIDVAIPLFGKSIRREARLATEEEKERLFQAIKDNGYKWNEETKTLEKLVTIFKVGDKIKLKNAYAKKYDDFNIREVIEIKHSHYILDDKQAMPLSNQYLYELVPDRLEKLVEPQFNKFKDGDVIFCENHWGPFISIFKENVTERNGFVGHCVLDVDDNEFKVKDSASYFNEVRFATKREKEQLFRAIERNGYKWNEETKTLEKVVPKFKVGDKVKPKNHISKVDVVTGIKDTYYILNDESALSFTFQDEYELIPDKFDINTLVPFESRVLVRDRDNDEWRGQFFSHYHKNSDRPYICIGVEGLCEYKQCIPYKGNEHLLSTTNDCDEHFKTWK